MHHESFCCCIYMNSIPFPTRRLDAEYVAQVIARPEPLPETCPEKCRPQSHPEWTRC